MQARLLSHVILLPRVPLWHSPQLGAPPSHYPANQALNPNHLAAFFLVFITDLQQAALSPSSCHSNPSPITAFAEALCFPHPPHAAARVNSLLPAAVEPKSATAPCVVKPILFSMQQGLNDSAQGLLLLGGALHLWAT